MSTTANHSTETYLQAYGTWLKPRLAHLLGAFGLDICYRRAHGDFLYFEQGDGEVEVVDFVGGFGASLLGHNHPELVELAKKVLSDGQPFHSQASIRGVSGLLAERLSKRVARTTGRSYVATLASTGAESVEAAIKHAELEMGQRNRRKLTKFESDADRVRGMSRRGEVNLPAELYHEASERLGGEIQSLDGLLEALHRNFDLQLERAPLFLAMSGSFHGKSTGALRLTHRDEFRSPWRRLGPPALFLQPDGSNLGRMVESCRLEYLGIEVDDAGTVRFTKEEFVNISGIFVEPIQGEGGIREVTPEVFRALRQTADEVGCPLIIDEIQSGMGRCGSFLASERSGIRGDYYLFSKSLGGSLAKISALLVDRERYEAEFGYLHTSTLAEDDFSSAIALGALDLLERDGDNLIHQCARVGDELQIRLKAIQRQYPGIIRDVRGRGLMIGFELEPQVDSPSQLLRVLSEQNLLSYIASGYLLREHRIRVAPTLSTSAVIRLEPSAYISTDSIDRLITALRDLCENLAESRVARLIGFIAGRDAGGAIFQAAGDHVNGKSIRPRSQSATRVGFLVHFSEPADLRGWEPRLGSFSEVECARILDKTQTLLRPFILDQARVRSVNGSEVEITFIGVPFTSEQAVESMRAGSDWTLELVREGVDLARQEGCVVVGLGGHTSIVSDNCRKIVDDQIIITSGNSLTVAAAYEATSLTAARLGLELSSARMAIVGAAGNIGSVFAQIAADEVGELLLVGRAGTERFLAPLAQTIYARAFRRFKRGANSGLAASISRTRTFQELSNEAGSDSEALGGRLFHGLNDELGPRAPIRMVNSYENLATCQMVVSATSAPRPVILPKHIAESPVVVCDIAIPQDVAHSVATERPNAVVLRGGRVLAPLGQSLNIPVLRLSGSEIYGCLAETILLGFAGRECPASYGNLSPFRVRQIRKFALDHGFSIEEKYA